MNCCGGIPLPAALAMTFFSSSVPFCPPALAFPRGCGTPGCRSRFGIPADIPPRAIRVTASRARVDRSSTSRRPPPPIEPPRVVARGRRRGRRRARRGARPRSPSTDRGPRPCRTRVRRRRSAVARARARGRVRSKTRALGSEGRVWTSVRARVEYAVRARRAFISIDARRRSRRRGRSTSRASNTARV